MVTFDVTIDIPAMSGSYTVANQAFVETPTGTVSSNDPHTADPNDPTIVEVVRQSIPDLGPAGSALLVLLLAAAGLLALRRGF